MPRWREGEYWAPFALLDLVLRAKGRDNCHSSIPASGDPSFSDAGCLKTCKHFSSYCICQNMVSWISPKLLQYFWLANLDISGDVGWCHSIFENMQTPSHPNKPTESGIIIAHSSILLKVISRILNFLTAVVEIEASEKRAKVETENQFWLKSGRGNEDVWPILAGSKNLWTLYSANEAVWPTIPRSFKTFHLKCFSY